MATNLDKSPEAAKSFPLLMAFDGELEMVVQVGREIGATATPPRGGVAVREGAPEVRFRDGVVELVKDAVRLVSAEVPHLGRLKWW